MILYGRRLEEVEMGSGEGAEEAFGGMLRIGREGCLLRTEGVDEQWEISNLKHALYGFRF